MANSASMTIEVKETVSPDDDSLCRVVPACIATNDGGATPETYSNSNILNLTINPFRPELTIVIFIHFKPLVVDEDDLKRATN